jgi:ATP-dependent Clp protease ATP-binding subunit ClpA
MWRKFTERARRVVFFSQEEAAMLGESDVAPVHVLLGILRDTDCYALRILDRLDVSAERVKSTIFRKSTRGTGNLGKDMVLTPSSKRVLDLALASTVELGLNYIGTEHILIGLIREGESLAAEVLQEFNVTESRVIEIVRAEQGDNNAQRYQRTKLDQPVQLDESPAGIQYVVLAQIGAGSAACVKTVLVTVNYNRCVHVARSEMTADAPLMRYEARVVRHEEGVLYNAKESDACVVFRIVRSDVELREEWPNDEFKQLFYAANSEVHFT